MIQPAACHDADCLGNNVGHVRLMARAVVLKCEDSAFDEDDAMERILRLLAALQDELRYVAALSLAAQPTLWPSTN